MKELHEGKAAYKQMSECCDQVARSGNWQRVGTSDIRLFLDMYVQSLLLKLARAGGTPGPALLTYIGSVPGRDILQIGKATLEQALNIGYKNRSFAKGSTASAAVLPGDG